MSRSGVHSPTRPQPQPQPDPRTLRCLSRQRKTLSLTGTAPTGCCDLPFAAQRHGESALRLPHGRSPPPRPRQPESHQRVRAASPAQQVGESTLLPRRNSRRPTRSCCRRSTPRRPTSPPRLRPSHRRVCSASQLSRLPKTSRSSRTARPCARKSSSTGCAAPRRRRSRSQRQSAPSSPWSRTSTA